MKCSANSQRIFLLGISAILSGCLEQKASFQFNDKFINVDPNAPKVAAYQAPSCQPGLTASAEPALYRWTTAELRTLPRKIILSMVSNPTEAEAILTHLNEASVAALIPASPKNIFDRVTGSTSYDQGTINSLALVAQRIESSLRSNSGWLNSFTGCSALATQIPSCLGTYLTRLTTATRGRAAPASAIAALSSTLSSQPQAWLQASLLHALLSPETIYRSDIGDDVGGNWAELDDIELAQRLASVFWMAPWDSTLKAWAESNQIRSQYEIVIQYVFNHANFRNMMRNFGWNYLRLDALPNLSFSGSAAIERKVQDMGLSATLPSVTNYRSLVQSEAIEYFMYHITRDSSFASLFLGEQATASGALAAVQGVNSWSPGTNPASHPAQQRRGLFTLSAINLSPGAEKNHIKAGYRAYKIFLCGKVPTPEEAGITAAELVVPAPSATLSSRERQAAATSSSRCASCHSNFNHLGFMLGRIGPWGEHRAEERVYSPTAGTFMGTVPIDSSVTFRYGQSLISTSNVQEFSDFILGTGVPQLCFARQFMLHAFGKEASRSGEEGCVLSSMASKLRDGSTGIREALKELARSPRFLRRKIGGSS